MVTPVGVFPPSALLGVSRSGGQSREPARLRAATRPLSASSRPPPTATRCFWAWRPTLATPARPRALTCRRPEDGRPSGCTAEHPGGALMKQLIALAKADANKLNYGSAAGTSRTAAIGCSGLLVDDRVAQHPDPLDFHLDHIARLEKLRRLTAPADAGGGAGHQHVARCQVEDGRAVADDGRDLEDQVPGVGRLLGLAGDAQRQAEALGIAYLVRRHHPRPERTGANEVLAGRDLLGMELPLANADIVVAGVAGDMGEGVLLGDVPAALADDHGQLGLPVELVRDLGAHDRLAVPYLRAPHAQKDGRELAQLALESGCQHLLVVVHVVPHQADDLFGPWNEIGRASCRERV